MPISSRSMLLIGESGVGKTHYGAQLLKRLMNSSGQFRMNGAATNLEPFEAALECLNDGRAAEHTPTSTYVESEWPIISNADRAFTLIWPDYGGEQIKNMLSVRRVPAEWKERVTDATAWLFMLRLNQLRLNDDLLSRPLATLAKAKQVEPPSSMRSQIQLSDQARMVELLQMLLFLRGHDFNETQKNLSICLMLSCWDELAQDDKPKPMSVLRSRLPMLADFVLSSWRSPIVVGLSALERPLDKKIRDEEYIERGPEWFGYVVLPNGEVSRDITLPIEMMIQER